MKQVGSACCVILGQHGQWWGKLGLVVQQVCKATGSLHLLYKKANIYRENHHGVLVK